MTRNKDFRGLVEGDNPKG